MALCRLTSHRAQGNGADHAGRCSAADRRPISAAALMRYQYVGTPSSFERFASFWSKVAIAS